MKYPINALLIMVVFFCQMACDDDSSEPKDMTSGIKLTFISEEIPSGLAVENFSLLSTEITENNSKKYYDFNYSFEIRNTGLQPFELQNMIVQATIIDGTSTYGAAGFTLPDATIAPGAKHKISYYANSGQLLDGLAVNGLTLRFVVKENDVPIITLNYLISTGN